MFELFETTTFKKVMKTLAEPVVQNSLNVWAAGATSTLDDSISIKFILIEGRPGSARSDITHRLVAVSSISEGVGEKEELVFADGVVLVSNSILQDAHMLLAELFRIVKIKKFQEEGSALQISLKDLDYQNPLELFDNSLTADFPVDYVPSVLYL